MRKLSNRKIAITFSILVIVAFIVLIATVYSPEDEEESTVPQQQNPSLGLDFDVGGLGEADEDCSTESEEPDEEEDCAIFELAPPPAATTQP
jgi:hypothetical protein